MGSVETVTGPIDGSELGTTLIHEHLQSRDDAVAVQWPHTTSLALDPEPAEIGLDRLPALATGAAEQVVERGVKTIGEPSCMFLNRDVRLMKEVSEATGLQIVPCTGIYTYEYLPPYFLSREPGEIADLFVHDIETGIQGTEIKAAFLKCAADEPGVTPNIEKIHRAVAQASLRTGTPIMAHSRPASETGPRQIEIFEEEGVDLAKVQIAHTGDTDDLDYIERVLDKGVFIGMDRFGLELFLPFDKRISTVLALLERGYADRMFLSADACVTIDWYPLAAGEQMAAAGLVQDWTWTMVPDRVVPTLREGGASDEQLETMLVGNAPRWLAGE